MKFESLRQNLDQKKIRPPPSGRGDNDRHSDIPLDHSATVAHSGHSDRTVLLMSGLTWRRIEQVIAPLFIIRRIADKSLLGSSSVVNRHASPFTI